jgi:lysophospholipase L1-like esterase
VGGIVLTASGTPKVLRSVKTLDDLVGVDPLTGMAPAGAAQPGVQAVVIGDSTAAGWGLPWGPNPTAEDQACGRSPESYAADLAAANQWNVLNLACGSATIENGLLGPEVLYNGDIAPPQLPLAAGATKAKVIIVSVGADDLSWSVMTQLCAASAVCDDKVSSAYFGQLLGTFTRNYYQLLSDLEGLPAHPAVLVNEYYSPFGQNLGCLQNYGMTPAKAGVLLARLGQLNTVLAQGANLFGFGVAMPRFAGHELCTADPWVQGPSDPAPLHPNAAGELAIALADEQTFPLLSPPPVVLPAPSPSPSPTATPALG